MTPYEKCAQQMMLSLPGAFESEAGMGIIFTACKRGPVFDRTDHGRAVIQHLFDFAWGIAFDGLPPKPELTDRLQVLKALLPLMDGNFNLFTQVAMNLLDVYLQVNQQVLTIKYDEVSKEFLNQRDLPNPFVEKKPKIKVTGATHSPEQVRRYAHAVSLIKVKSILDGLLTGNVSFRITPAGRTPALTDSMGLGNMPAAGDAFYSPDSHWGHGQLRMGFLSWGAGFEATPSEVLEDGTIRFPTLPTDWQDYKSESGGSMLSQVMTSRAVAFQVWKAWAQGELTPIAVIPRMNSVQIIAPREFLEARSTPQPPVVFTWDARPEIQKD
jgi:hypothetical protein